MAATHWLADCWRKADARCRKGGIATPPFAEDISRLHAYGLGDTGLVAYTRAPRTLGPNSPVPTPMWRVVHPPPPLRVSRPARARPRSRWTVWAIVSCFPRGCLWAPTHPHPGLHGLTGDLTMLTRRPLLLLVDYVRVTLEGGSAAPTTHSSRRPKIRWPRPSGRLRTGFGERSIAWPLQLL